jgi:hypothetical protein
MKPYWVDKVDPERYPVKALLTLWLKLLASNFGVHPWVSRKEYGQFKYLRRFLGEWTQFVVEWMLVPQQWRHFTAMLQLEARLIFVPLVPRIDFLLQQRTRALKIMREALRDSEFPAAIRFVAEQDLIARKNLLETRLLLSGDSPEMLSAIAAAKTPAEIQEIFTKLSI